MRLIADFWVAALLRQVRGKGGFGYLVRRGAAEAGVIFIINRDGQGLATLYGPAPQVVYEGASAADERRFIVVLEKVQESQITEKLQRELQFDPDIWIVEMENIDSPETLFVLVDDART